jgi:hypothetical protein
MKIREAPQYINMFRWRDRINEVNNGEITIKRNFIKLYLCMYKFDYKVILYSKDGFSIYELFRRMCKFQKICLIDYCENHKQIFCNEEAYNWMKKPENTGWSNNSIGIENGICDSLHRDGNKIYKTFLHS